jgi:uncharacterized damage-inducible protein DinB
MRPGPKSFIDALALAVQRLIQMLDGCDGEWLYRPPAPDEWCVAQTVWHLGDVEARYRQRLERIVTEDTPQVPAIWPGPAPEPLPRIRHAVTVFEQERSRTVAFLTSLKPDAWQRGVHHATLGLSTLQKQVQALIDHDEEHLEQILQTFRMREAGRRSE